MGRTPRTAENLVVSYEQAHYLDVGGVPCYAVTHRPRQDSLDTAIVICPPFGSEELQAYRPLRGWAQRLAASGYPVMRLTLPGCGDSAGSPRDPDRLDAWTESVSVAARTLRAATGADAVAGLGLGLGGLVAYRSAALNHSLDGLILWATPAHGSSLIRQLLTLSRVESALFFLGLEEPPADEQKGLEAGGFVLTEQTLGDLAALHLTELPTPRLARGAMLIGRDGLAPDEGLRACLEQHGVAVTVSDDRGYGDLTTRPLQTTVPEPVIEHVHEWLTRGAGPAARPGALELLQTTRATFEAGHTTITERPLRIIHRGAELAGILAEPARATAPVCPIFLHSAGVRRVGLSRMWVDAARVLASRGVPSVRLDLEGIGDAGGAVAPYDTIAAHYQPGLEDQIRTAIGDLHQRGVAESFILVGLSSGAYSALHAGLGDPRAAACVLLNAGAIIWDEDLPAIRDLRRAASLPLSFTRLRRNVTRERTLAVAAWVLACARRRVLDRRDASSGSTLDARLDALLAQLRESDKRLTFVFAEREPVKEELIASGLLSELQRWPNINVIDIPVDDHLLRPLWAQRRVTDAIAGAVAWERQRASRPDVPVLAGRQLAGPVRRRPTDASDAIATLGNASSSPQTTQTASWSLITLPQFGHCLRSSRSSHR